MPGQGNKRSAPHLPEAPPWNQPTASTVDEASIPDFTCYLATLPSCSQSQGQTEGRPTVLLSNPPSGQPQGHGCRNRSAAAHKAAFPTCWKVVSQSSGLRETSNTSSGLAEIFIHLHFQICSTFSLYKYRGSS